MAEPFTFKISGLDELQKTLEEIPVKVAKSGLRKALKAGGNVILDGMVEEAPEDSGFLKRHFGMRTKILHNDIAGKIFIGPEGRIDYPKSGGGYITKMVKNKAKSIGRIAVATVARLLEFGTSKMQKNPFMTRAFEKRKGTALEAIISSLRDTVAREAKK